MRKAATAVTGGALLLAAAGSTIALTATSEGQEASGGLAVFGGAPTASDALDSSLVNALQKSPGSLGGVDWSATRRASSQVWLTPDGSRICIHLGTASSGPVACGPEAEVAKGTAHLEMEERGQHQLAGVVPNDVARVVVGSDDGSQETLAVTNNAYSGSFSSTPTRISFSTPAGATKASLTTARKPGSRHRRHRHRR